MENKTANSGHPVINSSLRSFEDAVTYHKVHRHLRDINDTISEDDIRNVQTGIWLQQGSYIGVKEEFNGVTGSSKEKTVQEL